MGKEFVEFSNLRAQAYWLLRKKFQNGTIEIDETIDGLDLLRNEAMSVKYKIVSDKVVRIEEKDKIRSRLGRSPDYLDALVMAVFAKYLTQEIKTLIVL